MSETLMIALVMELDGEELRVRIETGGLIPPAQAVIACRAATEHFQQAVIEAEVQRRVEEAQQATEESDQAE